MIKRLLISLGSGVLVLFWLFQNSINTYWSGNFNSESPLKKLDRIAPWQWGAAVNNSLTSVKSSLISAYNSVGETTSDTYASVLGNSKLSKELPARNSNLEVVATDEAETPVADNDLPTNISGDINAKDIPANVTSTTILTAQQANQVTLPENKFAVGVIDKIAGNNLDYTQFSFPAPSLPLELSSNDQVLIVGDSMQQGVGRHIRAFLSKDYKIFSTNLAKQSTGLISPHNLNWNKTISNELSRKDQKFKLVIMMIGANDNFGLSDGGKAYPFGSEGWKAHYLQRIMGIMYEARTHNANIIWVLAPNMSRKDLNEKMQVVNELYRNAAKQYGAIVVDTNQVLGMEGSKFSPSMVINGRLSRTRANDGIHFTINGEKLIANAVMDKVRFNQPVVTQVPAAEPAAVPETATPNPMTPTLTPVKVSGGKSPKNEPAVYSTAHLWVSSDNWKKQTKVNHKPYLVKLQTQLFKKYPLYQGKSRPASSLLLPAPKQVLKGKKTVGVDLGKSNLTQTQAKHDGAKPEELNQAGLISKQSAFIPNRVVKLKLNQTASTGIYPKASIKKSTIIATTQNSTQTILTVPQAVLVNKTS